MGWSSMAGALRSAQRPSQGLSPPTRQRLVTRGRMQKPCWKMAARVAMGKCTRRSLVRGPPTSLSMMSVSCEIDALLSVLNEKKERPVSGRYRHRPAMYIDVPLVAARGAGRRRADAASPAPW